MRCVSGYKPLMFNQLCLNPKSAGQGSDLKSHSVLPTLYSKQKTSITRNGLVPLSCISCLFILMFYVILNRKAIALSINNPILRLFINNHSTYTDIPHMKGKQLKMSELFMFITVENPIWEQLFSSPCWITTLLGIKTSWYDENTSISQSVCSLEEIHEWANESCCTNLNN